MVVILGMIFKALSFKIRLIQIYLVNSEVMVVSAASCPVVSLICCHFSHYNCSSTVESLSGTDDPSVTTPTRCVASCSDASVRIVSPVSGDVITTCLVSGHRRLLCAAYAVAEGAVV